MNDDGSRDINKMDYYYKESEIETDRLICNGERIIWSPLFTYHGFLYVVISGITDIEKLNVTGIFVHQDIKQRADFECSDPVLTKLYRCGKISCWSNLFYQMMDCPTREKLGWMNEDRALMKQLLTNFEIEHLFAKWIVDIQDAMREDGSLPGIAPTCDGAMHGEMDLYQMESCLRYLIKCMFKQGDDTLMKESIPYFERYLLYLETRKDENGLINFGLPDWAAPEAKTELPVEFINAVLEYHFLRIAELAKKLSGENDNSYSERRIRQEQLIKGKFISGGKCIYQEQTAVSMLIYFDLYDDLNPLARQLKELVEKESFHHHCGMVGLRHLYYALIKCGLTDYAVRIITNPTYPSQAYWLTLGANTLWELWEPRMSRNHHMYSDFMGWVIGALWGICADESYPGFTRVFYKSVFSGKSRVCKRLCEYSIGQIRSGMETGRDEGIT